MQVADQSGQVGGRAERVGLAPDDDLVVGVGDGEGNGGIAPKVGQQQRASARLKMIRYLADRVALGSCRVCGLSSQSDQVSSPTGRSSVAWSERDLLPRRRWMRWPRRYGSG